MKNQVTITGFFYHGEATETQDFNTKMTYIKNGKTYLAHLYVCFFHRYIYEGKNNPKEHKLLLGALTAVREFALKKNWIF